MPIYMKVEGFEGEVEEKDHQKWLELESFQFGANRSGYDAKGSTHSSGNVALNDIVCTKQLDKSSTKFFEFIAKGEHIKKVEVHFVTTLSGQNKTTYMAYELKDTLITSWNMSGAGDSRPMESFSLNFSEIKLVYTQMDKSGKSAGKMNAGYDLRAGKPV